MLQQLEIGATYVRVSSDDQTELSPDAQIRVVLEAAKADGYIIPPEYIFMEKKGISGRKADNRPEFQRMIALAKSHKPAPFKRLYLWKFSRFARNQEESAFYKGILRKKCGIEVKSVSEPIMEGMFGRLIEMIIEWFDEYYSINLSGEVLRGMTEKALRQGYQTAPCLGYKAVGGGQPFVVDESEYAIVELIFSAYHNGLDLTGVARKMNALGNLTKHKKPFDRRAIYRILTNRFYTGTVCWNGMEFQGAHIVSKSVTDIFAAVQERLAREYRPIKRREASTNAHWLSGLLKCSICGSSLGFNRSNDQKKRPDFFQCWKYAKGIHPGSCCVSARIAENAVIRSLKGAIDAEEFEYEYIPRTDGITKSEENAIKEALARLEIKERRIKDAYENEVDTLEEYKLNKQRLNEERMELVQSSQRLHEATTQIIPSKEELLKRFQTIYNLLIDTNVGYDIKGNALRSILKDAVYDRENKRFFFHYYVS